MPVTKQGREMCRKLKMQYVKSVSLSIDLRKKRRDNEIVGENVFVQFGNERENFNVCRLRTEILRRRRREPTQFAVKTIKRQRK